MTTTTAWPGAVSVANKVAGSYPLGESYHLAHVANTLGPVVVRCNALVEQETGLPVPGAPEVVVVSRVQWVERNLGAFSHLLEPAIKRIEERLDEVGLRGRAASVAARRFLGMEMGALLGVLSRRVLGQYELVLPTGGDGDSMAFVGVNIIELERAHQFIPSAFRTWIALHECTHRAQFVGVPWMRDHFRSLVEELLSSARPEPGRWSRLASDLKKAIQEGRPLIDERGLLGLLAGPKQRETLDKVQGLMCLLEGHGHVVMDRIGEREVAGQARMSAMLKARRADPRTASLYRLLGVEMKLRQYEMGAAFVNYVEQTAGWDALAIAWQGVDALPTLAEIEEPQTWLERVG